MPKGTGKGTTNNLNGRPKGIPNKATQNAREAIGFFVDGNAERLNGWLDAIAKKDPKQAFDCFMSVVEYHVPKLQRSEIVGDVNAPVFVISAPEVNKDSAAWLSQHLPTTK